MLQSEVKRRFRGFEGNRLVFTRLEKAGVMFMPFVNLARIIEVIYDLA